MKTSIRDLLSPAVLILCVLRPIQVSAQAGTGEAVLFVGPRHVFSLTAPRGWILDVRSDRNNGLPGVLYRKGTTWEHSAAAMYVNTIVPDSGAPDSVAQVIREDIARVRADAPAVIVDSAPSLPTRDGHEAEIRTFRHDAHNNVEAVAYIQAPTIVTIIVLTARSTSAYEAALSAFRAVVKSYTWVTDSITVTK